MPIVKVWCLPLMEQKKLWELKKRIKAAVVSVEELELRENDITCLFPLDMMSYELGEEIIVEVTGFFETAKRTVDVRTRLARALGQAIFFMFPEAKIECFIYPFHPVQGFWTKRVSKIDTFA